MDFITSDERESAMISSSVTKKCELTDYFNPEMGLLAMKTSICLFKWSPCAASISLYA